MCELSASIVIYKSNPEMLQQTIKSFLQSTIDAPLYLIDNSPTDEARGIFDDPRITYIYNGKNIGFGAAHNVGLRKVLKSSAKYHLVLNPDVYFDGYVIDTLYRFMEANPEIGL